MLCTDYHTAYWLSYCVLIIILRTDYHIAYWLSYCVLIIILRTDYHIAITLSVTHHSYHGTPSLLHQWWSQHQPTTISTREVLHWHLKHHHVTKSAREILQYRHNNTEHFDRLQANPLTHRNEETSRQGELKIQAIGPSKSSSSTKSVPNEETILSQVKKDLSKCLKTAKQTCCDNTTD